MNKSLLTIAVTIGALTPVGLLAGAATGWLLTAPITAAQERNARRDVSVDELAARPQIRELAPLIANLADHTALRVRVSGQLVFQPGITEDVNLITAQIRADSLAYLTTLTLAQVQGALGLATLKADLLDRARLRSGGKVRDLLIESLVVQ